MTMRGGDEATGGRGDIGRTVPQSPTPSVSPSPTSDEKPQTARLRRIESADFEKLYALDQLCFEPAIAYSRQELRRFLSLPTAQGVVAEQEGALAGFSIGYVAPGPRAHVVTLDIHPRRRRHGLGRALLKELLRRLGQAGAREAVLEVDTKNAGAIAFYERFGFRKRRRLPDYYAPGRPAWEMSRELKV